MTREELNVLVAAYKGAIKRPLMKQYRHQTASGKLVTPKNVAPVRYLPHSFRANKKRGGQCPDYRGWDLSPRSAATRDY